MMLFSSLGQDPIEDAPGVMHITDSLEERRFWVKALDSAVAAAMRADPLVVRIVNASGGYRILDPREAIGFFNEIGYLYLKEVGVRAGAI
ncbi:hypothetical protein [Stenotrophomonas rhizophila]|jgi:hypothetical protein|uniref:hypothetical protein n=1 Tax=Stenotrophomonas rhizophila TaxID=216778 RepID=UPI003AF81CD7